MVSRGGRVGRLRALLVVGAIVVASTTWLPSTLADVGQANSYGVPTSHGAVIWDGESIWQFGSEDGVQNEIRRFDPQSRTLTVLPEKLPAPRWAAPAVFDGQNAYIVGGSGPTGSYSNILKFSLATSTLSTVTATLPAPRTGAGAVWTGQYVYIVGGLGTNRNVFRLDPVTGVLTQRAVVIDRAYAGVAYDGRYIWVIGGRNNAGAGQTTVIRYDPVADTQQTMSRRFHWPTYQWPAVFDGTNILLFGGYMPGDNHSGSPYSHFIYKYDIAKNVFNKMTFNLPERKAFSWIQGRAKAMAVWADDRAYVFGGFFKANDSYDSIYHVWDDLVEFIPLPGKPRYLTSAGGPGVDEATIQWDYPDPTTFSPAITKYRVWAIDNGVETYLGETKTQSFIVGGIPPGGFREFRVTAVNKSGEGPLSDVIRAYQPKPPGAPSPVTTAMGPGGGEITVKWVPTSDGGNAITHYNVFAGSAPGQLEFVGQVPTPYFIDSGWPNGAVRYYRVSAVNEMGESLQSYEVSGRTAMPPTSPQRVTALPGMREVQVDWSPPVYNGGIPVTSYRIYRATGMGAAMSYIGTVSGNLLYFHDRSCANLAYCTYAVSAVNGAGEGPSSGESVTFATKFYTSTSAN